MIRTGTSSRSASTTRFECYSVSDTSDLPPFMCPHPKLGCDCEWRFDDHWCRWEVVERIVWSVVIYCRVTLPGHMAPFLSQS